MERIEKKGLTIKNLIAIGVFNAVFFAVIAVFGSVCGVLPPLYLFFYAIASPVAGPVFMLIVSRSPKTGTIFISGIIQGLVWLLLGAWYMIIFTSIFGFAAEFIAVKAGYRKKGLMLVSFIVYLMGFFAMSISVPVIFTDFYYDMSIGMGSEADYINSVINAVKGPLGLVSLVVTVAAGIGGGLFGQKLMKKHFSQVRALV